MMPRRLISENDGLPSYAFATGCVAVGALLRLALAPLDPNMAPRPIFYPWIMLAALAGGVGPGLWATALTVAASAYVMGGIQQAQIYSLNFVVFLGNMAVVIVACGRFRQAVFGEMKAAAGLREAVKARDEAIRELHHKVATWLSVCWRCCG